MADKYERKWVNIFGPGQFAITLGQTSYYSCTKEEVDACAGWRQHEDVHKEQWNKEGVVKFAIKYLWYNITCGYENNPYEVEARQRSGH